jgi:glutamyl-tRNA reductase
MQRLFVLGLNHTTAPLEVRERLAFDADARRDALKRLRQRFDACEAVLLSTCNRVEIYLAREAHGHPRREDLEIFLAEVRGLRAADFSAHLYEKSERAVVGHLFTVAASLDSMVLGETQILGQVREAYDAAREAGTAGAMLHPLFQRAVAVGRQVMTETSLAEGRVSVASAAVDYAKRIFDGFSDKTVLNIGAGKMAGLMLTHLAALKPGQLMVCNRDAAKAAELASRFDGNAVALEGLADHLAAADIVVTSTGAAGAIITKPLLEAVMRRRRYKAMFLIDVAVPRDVASDVGKMENVYLYNLDDLQRVVSDTRSQRGAVISAAEQIVEQQVKEFAVWHRTRMMGPMIAELRRRSHEMAREEVQRVMQKLPNVSDAEKEHLGDLARRIVNKLLHDPIEMLRHTDNPHVPIGQYIHAMEKLFKLDADKTAGSADDGAGLIDDVGAGGDAASETEQGA